MENLPKPFYSKKSQRGVLLLHAYSGSANDVRMLARSLEKANYTVYAPILSGHGTLEPLDILDASVEQWRQDVRNSVAYLKNEGITQLAVFGLSMGGILAMDLLTEDDPAIVAGGVFCSPLFPGSNRVTESFLHYSEGVYRKQGLAQSVAKERLEQLAARQPEQLQAIENLAAKAAQKLPNVTQPVYIAQGGADQMIDPTTAYHTLQALSQTDVSFHWFAKSGHVITVAAEHQQFEATVGQFIENLTWNEEN